MPSDPPFRLIAAALRLGDNVTELTESVDALNGLQDRLERLERNSAEILGRALGDKAARANSLLLTNRHKLNRLQNAMAQAQKGCESAREAVESEAALFQEILGRQARRTAAADLDDSLRQMTLIAFRRCMEGLIEQCLERGTGDPPETDFVLPEESHGYIPFGLENFLDTLFRLDDLLTGDPDFASETDRYRPLSFLEVGCGPGKNLLMAQLSGILNCDRYAGFDLNEQQVQRGRDGLGLTDELFVADALEVDYGPYDLIFSYRPIRTPDLQQQLEARIVETMTPGAYLVAPLDEGLAGQRLMRRIAGTRFVWKRRAAPVQPEAEEPDSG
ncbi:hypothetical protein SAMN05444007_107155 [Cribrihabitans marinus]|uniref:Methyltransferase domain-containing protein n=1 Tax=Cribrihabitans marinus TaxID=1227549 RepID=A0A1H7BRV9_9RHOB|nr:class I SAM-dependent methyltransferase [Cribrihabitans marinus]GGH33852.1 hypothetical protein GCM10010973_26190 [Cribrihabitans marinus]SEJ80201.1 hypothetical protein SAMN05444007_107155 [Cribrihabitans marinus]